MSVRVDVVLLLAILSSGCDANQANRPAVRPDATAPAPSATVAAAPGPTSTAQARAQRGTDALRACNMASVPVACATDSDCATIDVPAGPCGGCVSTVVLGINASRKRAYLESNPCKRASCNKPSPSCVVHWHYAEEGPEPSPSSEIGAHCVSGACVSRYLAK